VPEVLSKNPSIQEVLWNFSRFKDERQCLTLVDNPHFYEELPTSPEAYGDGVQIDPTEDFQHSNKFYVLTDKAELVYIMTDHWGQVSQSFGNFWRPHNAIIFKGLGIVFVFFPLFLMVCQTSVGSGGKALSRHFSEAHTVGSVSGFRCPPYQELPGIVMDLSQLSHWIVHG
jgi:hypothetical protein